MAESFEDRYLDVLQNIESAIVATYRQYPELHDRTVRDVVDFLICSYQIEACRRSLPVPHFSSPTKSCTRVSARCATGGWEKRL